MKLDAQFSYGSVSHVETAFDTHCEKPIAACGVNDRCAGHRWLWKNNAVASFRAVYRDGCGENPEFALLAQELGNARFKGVFFSYIRAKSTLGSPA